MATLCDRCHKPVMYTNGKWDKDRTCRRDFGKPSSAFAYTDAEAEEACAISEKVYALQSVRSLPDVQPTSRAAANAELTVEVDRLRTELHGWKHVAIQIMAALDDDRPVLPIRVVEAWKVTREQVKHLSAENARLRATRSTAEWRRVEGRRSILSSSTTLAVALPLGDGTWSWVPHPLTGERMGVYSTEAEAKAAAAEALGVEVENG